MNLRESSGIALGALRANKMRSFLTLLGTIIGVASVIAVLSFVEGLNRFVSQKLLNAGANVFWVDKWGVITSQAAWEDAQGRPDFTMDDVEAIRRARLPNVEMVVAMDDGSSDVRFKAKKVRSVRVRGRGAGYEIVDDVQVERGRHLTELDDQRRQPVTVIGPEVADELFGRTDPLGQWVRIGAQRFQVVGVTKVKGKLLGSNEDLVAYIPVRTFQKYKRERGTVGAAIKSRDQASLALAQQEVRNIVRGRHNLRPGKPDDFGITTSETLLELWRNLTGGIFIVTIGVAAISLVVGGIVIMNIMLVSVTERTREIGVRKALGARRRDILSQFLVESTTLSVTGGLVGIAVGCGLALLVAAVSPLPAAVSMPAIILGILMSTMIGIFFGSYPAVRASRLDPIEALRYE
jgi:putative ABC transport system permease protein